jgi:N-acetylmuramoyl-L-alanine amidase
LTFTQGDASLVRTISRSAPSNTASYLKKSTAEIIKGSEYPRTYNVYITPGEKITFRCTAPIGADVSVTLAGTSYKLIPAATKSPGTDAIYYTGYSYTYTMPKTSVTGKVLVIGTPVYTMKYKGKTATSTATADLRCITPEAPYYAKVKNDDAFIYANSSTSGGPIGELKAGMTDYITAVTSSGTWVRLRMGAWIKRVDIERINGDKPLSANLSKPVYTVGDKWDQLKFSVTDMPAAKISFSGSELVLTVSSSGSSSGSSPAIKLPAGSMVSAFSSSVSGGNAIYRLTLDPKAKLDGYYLDTSEGTLSLNLKRRPQASASVTRPLDGLVIMLDPGHGNSDTGALGPLGVTLPEKDIALYTAMKVKYELESLGADVLMTRSGDEEVTLEKRLMNQEPPSLTCSFRYITTRST